MIRLSIIIPAYNEEKTIIKILDKVNKVKIEGIEKEILRRKNRSAYFRGW